MDVLQVVKGIHARVEAESGGPAGALGSSLGSNARAEELVSLNIACRHLYELRNLVGQTPPAPNSLRARLGGHIIRVAQRALFWYTPQIRRFNIETAAALSTVHTLMEGQFHMIAALRREVQTLQRSLTLSEMDRPRDGLPAESNREAGGALPEPFLFALQDHFRGPESRIAEGQANWLRTIETVASPAVAEGVWLDIGCGRGEWLAMASHGNREVRGIDSNPASVSHCIAKGLHAQVAEAIDYLSALPPESLAVVTAFHVVEHLPMDILLAMVAKATRALRPGGLLVVETPNPGNLLMGAHHFWNDPTHQRPIPAGLLEFVFSYCGLKTVKRVELNPAPAEHHLPYSEVEVIGQVDRELYGPRDYGLIGRREA